MKDRIEEHSLDIRDISYFIDHVKDVKLRIDIIKNLGYKIGVNVATKGCKEKEIIIGKKNDLRMQIAPKDDKVPLVVCAIIE